MSNGNRLTVVGLVIAFTFGTITFFQDEIKCAVGMSACSSTASGGPHDNPQDTEDRNSNTSDAPQDTQPSTEFEQPISQERQDDSNARNEQPVLENTTQPASNTLSPGGCSRDISVDGFTFPASTPSSSELVQIIFQSRGNGVATSAYVIDSSCTLNLLANISSGSSETVHAYAGQIIAIKTEGSQYGYFPASEEGNVIALD